MDKQAPDNWFEDIYANSDTSGKGVPWATLKPAPLLVAWLDRSRSEGHGRRAMVVGCGLGDDAVELARRGFEVSAFDVSESAIELARDRHQDRAVSWHVAELFDLPAAWSRAFDVVVEHRTIQSLPPVWQPKGQQAIADLVAPGGTLILVADLRPDGAPQDGPPWRLRPEELAGLASAGLDQTHDERVTVDHAPGRERLLGIYRRPT